MSDREMMKLLGWSIAISLLLSAWVVYQDDTINSDGIYYVQTADMIRNGDWKNALSVNAWPFYSILIAGLGAITQVSSEISAHILNATFLSILVVTYLLLLRQMNASRNVLLAGAIVILAFPSLNGYRDYIIRDTGYLAFYLASLLFLFRYVKTLDFRDVLGWTASIVIAALFRIEGVVIMVFAPLAILALPVSPLRDRLNAMIVLYSPLIILAIAALLFIVSSGYENYVTQTRFFEPLLMFTRLESRAWNVLMEKANIINTNVFNRYSNEYGVWLVLVSFIMIIFVESIKSLTVVLTIFTAYGIMTRAIIMEYKIYRVWLWYIMLNLLTLSVFVINNYFIVGRYPMALSLTLLLVVPFVFARFYQQWTEGKVKGRLRYVYISVVAILSIIALDGIISIGPGKVYIKESGYWLKEHIKENESLYTNDTTIMYYAGRNRGNTYIITHNSLQNDGAEKIQGYDYVAMRISRKRPAQLAAINEFFGRKPDNIFMNRRGDRIHIYKKYSNR